MLNKPYEMLSQFIKGDAGLRMLSALPYDFPAGIHAVGRLDYHSEGLLLLTTDQSVTRRLFLGDQQHVRTYVVQAYKELSDARIKELRTGVRLMIKGGLDYVTSSCRVERIERPEWMEMADHELPDRIPSTWLEMSLVEGKYRQIRKMLRAVHHPCRRLVRYSIEDLRLDGLASGELRELRAEEFFGGLHIDWDGK